MSKPGGKRSNFQFTYDADNYLLDLVFKYREDIFTRGNTIKTWERVLNKFNQRFQTTIVQSRTINNRFKILRKNLENKLLNEQHPITELNLNENEKLLVNLNEFIRTRRVSIKMESDVSSAAKKQKLEDSDNPLLADERVNSAFSSPTNTAMQPPDMNLSPKQKSAGGLASTGFIQPPQSLKYNPSENARPLFSTNETHSVQDVQRPLESHHTVSGPSHYNIGNPSEALPPNSTSLHQSQHVPQSGLTGQSLLVSPAPPPIILGQPQSQQQQQQQQQVQSGLPRSSSNSRLHNIPQQYPTTPLSMSYMNIRGMEGISENVEDLPKVAQSQTEDTQFRRRIRDIPKSLTDISNNQEIIEQLVISQNEYNLQINELRREIQEFKDEMDYKFKSVMNSLDHHTTGVSIKLSNLFELLMSRKDIDTKLDRISKALEMDSLNQFADPNQNRAAPEQHDTYEGPSADNV
ncbi:uncharacterized protein RJT20DRAFT_132387 [Scheffersomyces xylosifermentans]|uniref:uncharacterized protein n=1 Tax=Scheffersomyces xylosifermentans TaxID=1304137 RepID=UPI00315DABD5